MLGSLGAQYNRRFLALAAAAGIFLGALVIVSMRLGQMCSDGSYCHGLTHFRETLLKSHGGSGAGASSASPAAPAATGKQDKPDAASNSSTKPASNQKPDPEPSQESYPGLEFSESRLNPYLNSEEDCAGFPDLKGVLVVMKTGASEAYSKVPTQLLTNLRCVSNYLIFSDMQQELAGQTIHDSLDTVKADIKKNDDFKLYFRQKQCPTEQAQCNKYEDVASQGWSLDKYKNVHIAEKTYHMKPDYDWYLFTDADTYVIWPTLMEWLKHLDPSKKRYLGSVAMLGNFPFGHGGSGYLVSRASMEAMFKGKKNVANRWDKAASETCCGDYVFAYALKNETKIPVENVWPTINGEKPSTLAFNDEQWCQPIVTMHHIASEEVSQFTAFEEERMFSQPMRFKDIYQHFLAPHLVRKRANWDNLSDAKFLAAPEDEDSEGVDLEDWEKSRLVKEEEQSDLDAVAYKSFEDCEAACKARNDCLQFKYYKKVCRMDHKIKIGAATQALDNSDDNTLSGWNIEAIKKWTKEHECGKVSWPGV